MSIKSLLSHSIADATFWTMLGVMLSNMGAFFFVFIMARMLVPKDYAVLVTCISIFGLLAVPAGILQLVVVRMVAEAKGSFQDKKIPGILSYFYVKIALVSLLFILLFVFAESKIDHFLHISDNRLLFVVIASAITYYFLTIGRAVLQGIFEFKLFAFSSAIEMVLRISVAITFALLGFAVLGALGSILVTLLIAFFYTFQTVKKHINKGKNSFTVSHKEIITYLLPAFFLFLGTTSFYTSDVILVKHYFPDYSSVSQAALYTGVSTLGKIIFFGVFGITSALLPIATARHTKKQDNHLLFYSCFGFALLYCMVMVGVYNFLPQYALLLLGNKQYQMAKGLLGLFSYFMVLHALVFLIANFLYSIRQLFAVYIVFIAAIAQIIGIILYHASLAAIVTVSIVCSGITFATLLGYTLFVMKQVTATDFSREDIVATQILSK